MAGAAAPGAVRYRGLRLPSDPVALPPRVAKALAEGRHQRDHTDACSALALTTDRALVWGAGAGHVAALLAGKLGLPHVAVCDPDPDRRAHVARIAQANGLMRLALCAAPDGAPAPTLLAADLTAGVVPPPPEVWDGVRAAAVLMPRDLGHAARLALFAAAAGAGLAYRPDLSRGPAVAFSRP